MGSVFLKKITIFLSLILIYFIFEIWFDYPRAVIEAGILSLVIVFVETWIVTKRPIGIESVKQALHKQEIWRFAVTPIFLVLGCFFLELVFENIWYSRGVLFLLLIGLGLIFYNLFLRFNDSSRYDPVSFESIANYAGLVSFFFMQAAIFSFQIFLSQPWYIFAIIDALFSLLLSYQYFWLAGVKIKDSWPYISVIVLLILESFWVLSVLPLNFYVSAIILSVAYYILINLSRNIAIDLLTPKMVKRYLLVGFISSILVLTTAQWR